jgi:hypothetical protein
VLHITKGTIKTDGEEEDIKKGTIKTDGHSIAPLSAGILQNVAHNSHILTDASL